jgi:hypothetical protein
VAEPIVTREITLSALTLTGKNNPSAAELTTALLELYPAADGPTVKQLIDDKHLCYCLDGQHLRLPPLTPDELQRRQNVPTKAGPAQVPLVKGIFSIFEGGGISNTKPTAELTPAGLHELLISSRYRAQTETLRETESGSTVQKLAKKNLDYITPAGIFSHRANAGLRSLSGLLVLDFDHLPDVGAAKAALQADEVLALGLVMLFTSPSGNGLKAIFWIDTNEGHLENFRAYADYVSGHYASLGLVADEAGKDVARACFLPFDPTAWLAPGHDLPAAS